MQKLGGRVYAHVGPFDRGITALRNDGFALSSARDIAEEKLLDHHHHPLITDFQILVAENFNYFPNGDILIASRAYNPLLKTGAAEKATDCHRNGNEFYLDEQVARDLFERAELDPEKALRSGVLALPRTAIKGDLLEIPTTAFKEEPVTYFLFRDVAKPYGRFLKDADVDKIPVFVVDENYAKKQERPFSRAFFLDPLWLKDERNDLYEAAGLTGDDDTLHEALAVIGMRPVSTERTNLRTMLNSPTSP